MRCQRSGRSGGLRRVSAALPGPCFRRSRSARPARRRGRGRRRRFSRRRRGGCGRGRVRPGRRRARCDRERPPAGRGGQRRHYFGSCATSALAVAAFGPSGASFRYVLNSVAGLRQLAFVHERHRQLIVRFGVVGLAAIACSNALLGVRNLAGVPEDDALVVERVGVAAGEAAGLRRPSARSPSRWPPPPRRTSAGRCRCWRARCRPRRSRA